MTFMLAALLIGVTVLLASLVTQAVATAFIVDVSARFLRTPHAGRGFWMNVVVMMFISLITAAAHLVQIGIWAVVLMALGEISTFEAAFYCSAENYTALGYGDVMLSERWRLLGPLEAINGLLLFGVSTATMFAVMSRLIANRLRHRLGKTPNKPS
jgi:hypothetical protein